MTELKRVLKEKIAEFEGYQIHPMYQSEMEQNAIRITLRELIYLDSIAEWVGDIPKYDGKIYEKPFDPKSEEINKWEPTKPGGTADPNRILKVPEESTLAFDGVDGPSFWLGNPPRYTVTTNEGAILHYEGAQIVKITKA